jgi:hypothetical protein
LGDDFHVANEINNELNKGVYIIWVFSKM